MDTLEAFIHTLGGENEFSRDDRTGVTRSQRHLPDGFQFGEIRRPGISFDNAGAVRPAPLRPVSAGGISQASERKKREDWKSQGGAGKFHITSITPPETPGLLEKFQRRITR